MGEVGQDEEEREAQQLVDAGADVLGGVSGAALGTIGGPLGVIAGGAGGVAVARSLKSIGSAVLRRRLEERQESRAGAAFGVAVARISARVLHGDELRDDGFLEPDPDTHARSAAEEVLEGTMRAAADQHEERKVPFLGAFWANLAFRADVSRGYANFLLHLAERLTWRQLVLLARAGRSTDERAASLTEELDRRLNRDRPRDAGVPVELDELADLRLVEPPARRRTVGELEGGDMRMSFGDPGAGEPELTAMGRLLYELLDLSEVPQEEILDSI